MRKILLAISSLLILFPSAYSQLSAPCNAAAPACAQTGLTFTNSTGVTGYGSINCLGSTPNPTWYFLEVGTSGNIDMQLSQTNNNGGGTDVDFMLWGPFTSLSSGCASISSNVASSGADCSYAGGSAPENVNIVNGQPGSVYVLLITNYANQAGTITLNQTGGSGATNCGILSSAQNNGPVCMGQSLILDGTSSNSGGSSFSYNWYLTPDFTTSLSTSPIFTYTPTAPGSYQFALVITDLGTFDRDTAYTTGVVNPIPAAPAFTSTLPACQGSTVTLTPTPIVAGAIYNWTGSNGYVSNQPVVNFANATPGLFNGNYSLTVTINGCVSPPTTQPLSISPTNVPIVTGPTEACEGALVSLDVTNGNLFQSFSWNGIAGSDPQAVLAGSYTVTATDANGCITNSTPHVITLIPNPLDISGPTTFCEGSPITLTATSGKQSYLWSTGSTSGTSTVDQDGLVIVNVVSTEGCTRSDSVTVRMYGKPVASFSPEKICSGVSVTFQNNTVVDDNYGNIENAWAWYFGHSIPDTILPSISFDQEPNHVFPGPGTYNVSFEVTTNFGCKDTAVVPFVVIDPPHLSFLFESLCFGESKFTNQSSQGTYPFETTVWNFGDGSPISNATDSIFYHGYPAIQTYQISLTITDTAGCVSDSTTDVTLKTTPLFDDLPNIITPNGDNVNDSFTFPPLAEDCYNYTFALFNRWGSKVFETDKSSKGFAGVSNLGSKLQDGVYFWVLIANGIGQGSDEQILKKGTITVAGTK